MTTHVGLQLQFHLRILRFISEHTAAGLNYPTQFAETCRSMGSARAVKQLFASNMTTGLLGHDGFLGALLANRLDMTTEYIVWSETTWRPLFPSYLDYLDHVANEWGFEVVA